MKFFHPDRKSTMHNNVLEKDSSWNYFWPQEQMFVIIRHRSGKRHDGPVEPVCQTIGLMAVWRGDAMHNAQTVEVCLELLVEILTTSIDLEFHDFGVMLSLCHGDEVLHSLNGIRFGLQKLYPCISSCFINKRNEVLRAGKRSPWKISRQIRMDGLERLDISGYPFLRLPVNGIREIKLIAEKALRCS